MKTYRTKDLILIFIHVAIILHSVTGKNEYSSIIDKCAKEKNTFDCLKKRALEILDSAIDDDSVYVINDYVSVGKDPAVASRRSFNNNTSSSNSTGKSLDEQLDSKFREYLSSRSIRLYIPGDSFEGRKKKGNKYGGLLLGGLAVAGIMAQLAYGKIAFLAGTALLTAKIALVMSAIIGLKKLVSNSGSGHEVIYATASEHHGGYSSGYGGGGGGWQRAMEAVPPT